MHDFGSVIAAERNQWATLLQVLYFTKREALQKTKAGNKRRQHSAWCRREVQCTDKRKVLQEEMAVKE